jgi:hypothetical protein
MNRYGFKLLCAVICYAAKENEYCCHFSKCTKVVPVTLLVFGLKIIGMVKGLRVSKQE